MNTKDHLGYYKKLGVEPTATTSKIKAAYRQRAMELHPDRNQGSDTTAQFQDLQRAYEVLSNEKLRQQYDADSAVPPPAQPTSEKGTYKPFEPIVCSVCSAVTAQPRYKVFYSVFGYIFGATRRPHQGIFCSKCELKTAVKASAITMVAGWWSIHGFIWSIHALAQNLVGGTFYMQNAKLQGYQAMYFASVGKTDIARAVAQDALQMIDKANASQSKYLKYKQKLGYDTESELTPLRKILEDYLKSFHAESKEVRITANNVVFNGRFKVQLTLLLAFIGLIAGFIEYQAIQNSKIEAARLEQQGIERAQARAIAERQVQVLRSLEQPLPLSGVYSVLGNAWYNLDSFPPFKINNSPDANSLLKLVRVSDGVAAMSVFVRAGDSTEVGVPPGSYRIKVASGITWYGDVIRFGPDTSYGVLNEVFTFSTVGNQLNGNELTLKLMKDGNLKRTSIGASDF